MKHDPISSTEVELTRWIDNQPGAMPPENLDPRETAKLRADAEAVAALLRKYVPASVEPPYPDFFNSQLLKRVRDEHQPEPAAAPAKAGFFSNLAAWLSNPWMASAATAAIAVSAALWWASAGAGERAGGTRVLSVFSPEPNATTHVLPARDHTAVIVTVDGLEPFPDDRPIIGWLDDRPGSLIAAHQP